ncbi:MAG TPA: DNA polymerase III subunit chi [Gammaproteobacteria bacterium]|nr:DNA polymerase III subunit chi [Gammaproteobacteria bacterium]
MTRVDFYVLPGDDAEGRARVACRLAEKAFDRGHRVLIHTDSPGESAALDDLLWTFRAGSFVPHARQGADPDPRTPVLVGHGDEPDDHDDVLINLASTVPLFFSRFARVAEVIDQHGERLPAARERYRFYKDRGYELASHKLSG